MSIVFTLRKSLFKPLGLIPSDRENLMADSSAYTPNIDDIVNKIKQEAMLRKHDKRHLSASSKEMEFLRLSDPVNFQFKESYTLNDFLNYHDEVFVHFAYRAILGREADSAGMNHYLGKLRAGKLSKIEILGRLRYSPEGKKKRTFIKGLITPFVLYSLYRVPVIGYLLRWFVIMLRLPVLTANFEEFHAFVNWRFAQTEGMFNRNMENIESRLALVDTDRLLDDKHEIITHLQQQISNLDDQIFRLRQEQEIIKGDGTDLAMSIMHLREQLETVSNTKAGADSISTLELQIAEIVNHLQQKADNKSIVELHHKTDNLIENSADKNIQEGLRNDLKKAQQQITDHRLIIVDQQRRLALFLEEARKRLPEPLDADQLKAITVEGQHFLDAAYVAFEDNFRGTRRDIKNRQTVYLPYIREVCTSGEESLVVDIGCGRGEWLELLKENGYRARGVDQNEIMVEACRNYGLDSIKADVFDYLSKQPPNSLKAITGFHIVEHLTTNQLVHLFDEAIRVLSPNGIVIFETPNPENLLVGACYFYSDFTHTKPLVPESLRFLAEQRGFVKTKIMRLHSYADFFNVESDNDFINKWFYCEMDYSLIATKPS